MSHTPGPWRVEAGWAITKGRIVADIGPFDGNLLCVTHDGPEDGDPAADAALIAAAPELLAALKEARDWLIPDDDTLPLWLEEQIKSAIAKAEGRQ